MTYHVLIHSIAIYCRLYQHMWAIVVKLLYGQEVAMRGPTRRAIVTRRARKMRSIAPYVDAETTPGAVQSGVPA